MRKVNRNIIRIFIGVKILVLTGMLISIVAIGEQQFSYHVSDVPEHKEFLKEKKGVVFGLFMFLIPIAISLIVDFREQKKELLKGKWYIVTLSLVLGYVLINQLKGHYLGYIIAALMALGYIYTIRQQKQLEKTS